MNWLKKLLRRNPQVHAAVDPNIICSINIVVHKDNRMHGKMTGDKDLISQALDHLRASLGDPKTVVLH